MKCHRLPRWSQNNELRIALATRSTFLGVPDHIMAASPLVACGCGDIPLISFIRINLELA